MTAGAHLSHAARLAAEAQRAHLACVMHLEEGGAVLDEDVVAEMLDADDHLVDWLQALADEYGHQQVAASPDLRRAA